MENNFCGEINCSGESRRYTKGVNTPGIQVKSIFHRKATITSEEQLNIGQKLEIRSGQQNCQGDRPGRLGNIWSVQLEIELQLNFKHAQILF